MRSSKRNRAASLAVLGPSTSGINTKLRFRITSRLQVWRTDFRLSDRRRASRRPEPKTAGFLNWEILSSY